MTRAGLTSPNYGWLSNWPGLGPDGNEIGIGQPNGFTQITTSGPHGQTNDETSAAVTEQGL